MDWIEKLKVGDKVLINNRYGDCIGEVEAINKATIKVKGLLFSKKDGFLRGADSWNRRYLVEATEQRIKATQERLEREHISYILLHEINYSVVSLDTLRQIATLLHIK